MMENWNVLVVAERNMEKELLEELSEDGDFEPSGFRDVLIGNVNDIVEFLEDCLLYTSPSPRDRTRSRMPSSA